MSCLGVLRCVELDGVSGRRSLGTLCADNGIQAARDRGHGVKKPLGCTNIRADDQRTRFVKLNLRIVATVYI